MKTRALSFAGFVLIVLLLGVLIGLGGWQIQRLAWKNAVLADLQLAYATQDRTLEYQDMVEAQRDGKLFIGGMARGRLLWQDRVLVGPRTHDGVAGFHLYVPLRMKESGVVLVNLGWVAQDTGPAMRSHVVTIRGLARYPDRPNPFTPANDPTGHTWYFIDLKAIQAAMGLNDLAPYVLYAQKIDGLDDITTIPLEAQWQPPNNHLQYAVFWFGMAGLLVVLCGVRIAIGGKI